MKKITYVVLLILGCGTVQIQAQSRENQMIEDIKKAYDEINYTEAESKAKAALQNFERFQPAQLSEVHKYLGLIYFSQNKPDDARLHFESALSLNSELKLDPRLVSPKILEFFDQVKNMWELKRKNDDLGKIEVRYVLVQDPRSSAALRSVVLPGWGQYYKEEKTKGRIIMALWGLSVGSTLITHFARQDARDKYLAEKDVTKIDSRFNTFNTYHKLRNSLILASAGIWVYSFFDALLKFQSLQSNDLSTKESRLSISPAISNQHAGVSINMRF